jgi:uncharacterized protein (DUF1800 family)
MWTFHAAKRVFLMAALVWGAFAQAAATVSPDAALDANEARFLLTRSGFAASAHEIHALHGMRRSQAVGWLLDGVGKAAVLAPPDWANDSTPGGPRNQDLSVDERKLRRALEQQRIMALRGWWLQQMLTTSSPLAERMTLFWHSHFATSFQKVQLAQLMYRQNKMLREQALGNFATLLREVSRDPAMLIYLDNANSRKGTPNENFARELMELFTLGEGQYAEQDVKEAARAFTGWSVDRDKGEFMLRPALHDGGDKTVLGRSGKLDGDAVIDILLAQPACAEFIITKLWREFVSPDPDKAEVTRIANRFRESRYDLKLAMHELLLTPAFWDERNRAHLVKSPVEMVVGTLKQFNITTTDAQPFTFAVAQLGQNLFNPPNVKGWPGADAWINSATLLARKSVLERVFRTVETGRASAAPAMNLAATDTMMAAVTDKAASMKEREKIPGQPAPGPEGNIRFANAVTTITFDLDAWLAQFGLAANSAPDLRQRLAIQKSLLAMEPSAPIRADLSGSAYLRTLLMDPVYQLK